MAEVSLISTSLLAVSIVFPILSTMTVALRLYSRAAPRQHVAADDWFALITLALNWGTAAMAYWGANDAGVGTVKINPESAAEIFSYIQWVGAGMILGAALATVKISVLLFYGRIFTTETFQIIVPVMIAVCAAWGLSTVLTQLFATNPIDAVVRYEPGHLRYNYPAFVIAVASISLALDVIVLLLPMPVLRKLQMPLKRKLGAVGIFALGGLVVVASIARLVYLYRGIHQTLAEIDGPDPYQFTRSYLIWAFIEPNASIIAASLPTMLPLRHTKLFSSLSSVLSPLRSSFSGRLPRSTGRGTGGRQFREQESDPANSSDRTDSRVQPLKPDSNRGTKSKCLWPSSSAAADEDEDEAGNATIELVSLSTEHFVSRRWGGSDDAT